MESNDLYIEKNILIRVANGDEQAFEIIFKTYKNKIFTYIKRISGSDVLAQEILQDTFLKVWLKRESLSEIQNLGGWIYTVASNIAYNALVKEAANLRLMGTLEKNAANQTPETYTTTENILLEKEYRKLIGNIVQTLPERQRMTYKLIKEDGLTREEAAIQMGISPESIKTNLAIALSKIRMHCIARMGALGLLIFVWANR